MPGASGALSKKDVMNNVKVFWSEEDGEYVATFVDYPSLSGLSNTPSGALGELLEATRGALDARENEANELKIACRQTIDAVLANWRGNDGSLTVDTIYRLQALARIA